jgi:serine protease Do
MEEMETAETGETVETVETGETVALEPEPSTMKIPFDQLRRLMFITLVIGLASGLAGAYAYNQYLVPANIKAANKQMIVQESSAVIDVAKKVSPSVVSITSETTVTGFFGPQSATTAGTGIIVSSDGLIMTNRHVVADTNAVYTVKTADGETLKNARVVARDTFNDIAFVRVDAKNLPAIAIGSSANLQVGQKVVAIGNALGQLQNTVTEGIVSGIGRPITAGSSSDSTSSEQLTNLIQTDAAINEGNSGGPLVNLDGQLVGMNTATASSAQSIGFAIPVSDTVNLIASVEKTGKIVRPYIGIRYIPVTADIALSYNLKSTDGAWLNGTEALPSVIAGSPAEKAGLQNNDIITKVNNDKVTKSISIQSLIGRYNVGDTVKLTVVRDGKEKIINVTLTEAPAN